MRHDDAKHGPTGSIWTTERKKPTAKACKVGTNGTLAQVLGGDEIEVQAKSGRWYRATVAWPYNDGAAMLRMNDSLEAADMRVMGKTVPVAGAGTVRQWGAFDLVGRGGRAPEEICGKLLFV